MIANTVTDLITQNCTTGMTKKNFNGAITYGSQVLDPNTTSMRTTLDEWLAGLPIALPYMNDNIRDMGHDPYNFFLDCAN